MSDAKDKQDYDDYVAYQAYLAGQTPQPEEGQDLSAGMDLGGMAQSFGQGLVNEGTLNVGFPHNETSDLRAKHPTANNLGRVIGGLLSGYGIGKGLSKIPSLQKLMYPAKRAPVFTETRAQKIIEAAKNIGSKAAPVVANTGLSAAIGAVRRPHEGESRGTNAVYDAIFGGGASTLAELAKTVPGIARYLGGALGGVSPQEVEAFRKSPGSAEMLARGMNEGGADKINKSIQQMFKGSKEPGGYGPGLQSKLQTEVIDPLTAEKELLLSGDARGVRVNTADLEGASPEVQAFFDDIIAKQQGFPRTQATRTPIDTGTFKIDTVEQKGLPLTTSKTTPGQSLDIPPERINFDTEQMGLPITRKQGLPRKNPLTLADQYMQPRPEVPIELGGTISSGGFNEQSPLDLYTQPQTTTTPIDAKNGYGIVVSKNQLGLPLSQRGSQPVPAPSRPKTVVLSMKQADKLRATAWESARKREAAAALTPMSADGVLRTDPHAVADARIATSMRSATEEQLPKLAPMNDTLYDHIGYKEKIDSLKSNLGNVIKSDGDYEPLRSFYDRHTGSKLNDMANQYEAGKKLFGFRQMSAMNIPSAAATVKGQPVARWLINRNDLPPGVTGLTALQAILGATRPVSGSDFD